MTVFQYDRTFEGLLSAVFDAYAGRVFPERLIGVGEPEPMFTERLFSVETERSKADRVWRGLQKKMIARAANQVFHVWLSELPGCDELLFRYIRKIFDSAAGREADFTDADVLEVHKIAFQVARESEHIRQFVRFQKAGDDTYFAPIEPKYNCLALSLPYFKDRFADQKWMIYDTRRGYGFYYDRSKVVEINLPNDPMDGAVLDAKLMAEDEKLFQTLWSGYFRALTIRERINPKLQRRLMPARFWKYMPEMQGVELLTTGSEGVHIERKSPNKTDDNVSAEIDK
jgi:probable DNA metabolism protein